MILGATGLVLGFLNSPSTVSEAQQMVANSHHNESHDSSLDLHENFNDENKNLHNELSGDHYEKENCIHWCRQNGYCNRQRLTSKQSL